MSKQSPDRARETAGALHLSISLLKRRTRAASVEGELTEPELAALSLVDRSGPITIADLARTQQITPQAMGTTIASLETAGLLTRSPDPNDKRRSLFTASPSGAQELRSRRSAIADRMADAFRDSFTADEVETLAAAAPLIERLSRLI